jgi:hypothetical protein
MKNVRYVTARELGNCPASIRMDNGLIESTLMFGIVIPILKSRS